MLKKSKLFVIAIAFVAVFAVASVASAADLGTTTLKKGSTGPYVVTLQTILGVTPDGAFGPMTEAAVKAWQASHGLVADGLVGNATKASMGTPAANNPGGTNCQAGWAFNPVTGKSCTSTGGTPGLTGDAGELLYTSTTTDLESDVKEGATEKVLATKLEADGSDIEVKNVKVSFENNSGNGSTRLYKYVDEVLVMLGDEEVASVDAEDFSKDGDVYSKSIALSGAVVEDGEKANLYVAVSALSTVDDETATFDGIITQVRWSDGTGALFSDADSDGSDFGSGAAETFGFNEASVDDDMDIKTSSADPDAATLVVDEDASSDEYLVGAFKLDVDEDSSDIVVSEFPILVTFTASGNTTDDGYADDADAFIDEVRVEVDGEEYTASFEEEDITNGAGDAVYLVDDEFTVEAGDVVEVKIYMTFNSQENHYGSGAEFVVSTDETVTEGGSTITWSAEGEDELDVDGTYTGEGHTLSTSGAEVTSISWVKNGGGAASGSLDFLFTVEAVDGDVDITDDAFDAIDTLTTTGSASIAAAVVTKLTGTASGTTDAYTVSEGDTASFRVRYSVTGSAGSAEVTGITTVAGQSIPENKQYSDTMYLE